MYVLQLGCDQPPAWVYSTPAISGRCTACCEERGVVTLSPHNNLRLHSMTCRMLPQTETRPWKLDTVSLQFILLMNSSCKQNVINAGRNGAKRSSRSRAARTHTHTLGDLPRKLHLVPHYHPSGLMATYTLDFAADAQSNVTAIGEYDNNAQSHTQNVFKWQTTTKKTKLLEKPKFASPDAPGCWTN